MAAAAPADASDSTSAGSRRRRRSTGSTVLADVGGAQPAAAVSGAQQPPRSAADAAADVVWLLLEQLQGQPGNTAAVALARSALEAHARRAVDAAAAAAASARSSSWGAAPPCVVTSLAAQLREHSSPASLAALARAVYSRQLQQVPALSAALAEAVAAAAHQLGAAELHSVLRLLVEHLPSSSGGGGGDAADGDAGAAAMRRAFTALAQGMIGASSSLGPVQLAEAVVLLARHRYDDAYGLWMLAKAAAERMRQFAPGDSVALLRAVADMHVADDSMCAAVAAAVADVRGAYSDAQLADVAAALKRMGYEHELV